MASAAQDHMLPRQPLDEHEVGDIEFGEDIRGLSREAAREGATRDSLLTRLKDVDWTADELHLNGACRWVNIAQNIVCLLGLVFVHCRGMHMRQDEHVG